MMHTILIAHIIGPLFIASSIDEYYMLSGGCYFGTKVRSTDKEVIFYVAVFYFFHHYRY